MPYLFLKKLQMFFGHNQKTRNNSGFTLIEMIVALGIFTIAIFIATSTFLSVVNSDRKSRATRVATDNLNLTLEDMSRKIKTGSSYNCAGNPAKLTFADCSVASTIFAFTDQADTRIIYKLGTGVAECGAGYGVQRCILRSDGGVAFLPVTSPEIDITGLKFFVLGSAVWPDTKQPTVIVAVDGSLGNLASTKVAFKIQTTITQRAYDH